MILPHFKYVTTVHSNLSLIDALRRSLIFCHQCLVSLGTVATRMRCGGIFNKHFAANLLENLTVKKFENRLRINRDTAMSLVSFPFETRCGTVV